MFFLATEARSVEHSLGESAVTEDCTLVLLQVLGTQSFYFGQVSHYAHSGGTPELLVLLFRFFKQLFILFSKGFIQQHPHLSETPLGLHVDQFHLIQRVSGFPLC